MTYVNFGLVAQSRHKELYCLYLVDRIMLACTAQHIVFLAIPSSLLIMTPQGAERGFTIVYMTYSYTCM